MTRNASLSLIVGFLSLWFNVLSFFHSALMDVICTALRAYSELCTSRPFALLCLFVISCLSALTLLYPTWYDQKVVRGLADAMECSPPS